jgi:hypothetical protein
MALVSKTFSQIITFTRASTATYFDSAGVLQSAAVDAPRFDYNPSTLAAQGLLIEESRTNSIRNNTMVGAAAGTPGTLPTNWVTVGGGLGTLTQQIVGTGTSNGITYIDVKISGTTSTTSFGIQFDASTQIAALSGQNWTGSFWVSRVAGSNTNLTRIDIRVHERDAGGASLAATGVDLLPSLSTTLTRNTVTRTMASASTAFVTSDVLFAFNSGVAIDITLRIGLPQLELGAFATSVIPTTTTALTRAADVASVNTLSPWYNSASGTLYVEAVPNSPITNLTNQPAVSLDDASLANRIQPFRTSSTGVFAGAMFVSSVNVYNPTTAGVWAADAVGKIAMAFAPGNQNYAANGVSGGAGAAATLPVVTRLGIGLRGDNGAFFNGWIRRTTFYPRAFSLAELQTITA